MVKKHQAIVRTTTNFDDNLAQVEAFWVEREYPAGFDALLDELTDTVIPLLESHPDIGPDFLRRESLSVQEKLQAERLTAQLVAIAATGCLREFIMEDYILLYAAFPDGVYLLSIKHHKQLSFEFKAWW